MVGEVDWNQLKIADIGQAFRQGYDTKRQQNALAAYAQNPQDGQALNALAEFNPQYVVEQKQQQALMAQKQAEIQRGQALERAKAIGEAAQWADTPEKWDRAVDYLSSIYPEIAQYKGKFDPGVRMAAIAAAGKMAEYAKQTAGYTLGPGAKRFDAQNRLVAEAPFAPHYATVGEGDTVIRDQPPATGPLNVNTFLPAIVAQESGGNYAAHNPTTGAMGAYQVMPATGAALAQRLGLPWQPALMVSDSPEARAYQDKIGQAAVHEAVANSGGDPVQAAMYYHGGSDKSKWGPKTQAYGQQVAARLGSSATVVASGPPKQPKQAEAPSGYRWKADGTLEPIPGGPQDAGTAEMPPPKELARRNAAYPKASASYRGTTQKIDQQIAAIEKLKAMPGLNDIVGFLDSRTPNVFGPARAARALYDQIMARAQFNELQDMRQNSPTGGSLGQVSDAENKTLRQAAAALSLDQSETDFGARLEDYLSALKASRANIQQAYDDTYAYRSRGNVGAQQRAAPTVSNW